MSVYSFLLSSLPDAAFNAKILSDEIVAAGLATPTAIGGDSVNLVIEFPAELSDTEETTLNALVIAHEYQAPSTAPLAVTLPRSQADQSPIVVLGDRLGKEVVYTTHDFCDPSTWYSESQRVEGLQLRDVYGDRQSYIDPGRHSWVDITHGKIFDEESIVEDEAIFAVENGTTPHGYSCKVYKNGVELTERPPYAEKGDQTGDYTVNYTYGSVILDEALAEGDVLTADFSQVGGSNFVLPVLPGRILAINAAELQFAEDIDFTTSLITEIYGFAQFFAPDLVAAGHLQPTQHVPIQKTLYKTIDQFIDEAIGSFPKIPVLSPHSPRGYSQPRYVFQLNYGTIRNLFSSLGMYMGFRTENNIPLGGERATATFYCVSKEDPGPAEALKILSG